MAIRNRNRNSRYHPINQKWTNIDQCTNCTDDGVIIQCPVCRDEYKIKTLGHLDIYLDSDRETETHIGADIVCKHCHFTMNMDQGRNCWCVLKEIMLPKTSLKVHWFLKDKDKLPDDVQKDLKKKDW